MSSEDLIEELTGWMTPPEIAEVVEEVRRVIDEIAPVLPPDPAVAAAQAAFNQAQEPIPFAQQALQILDRAQIADNAARAGMIARRAPAAVPPMVASQRDALRQMAQNALVLGTRHFGTVFVSLLAAHVMAKGFEPLLNAQPDEIKNIVNRVLTGASITLTLGGLAWPRLSSGSAQRPNIETDFGRLAMASGTAMSFLAAYLSGTEHEAVRGNARLAVFTPVRDLLLNMISYKTNRDPANPDRLRPLIPPNVTYGMMQLLASLSAQSPTIFSGASTAAENSQWKPALMAFAKLSAVYAAPEAINLVLAEMVNVSADKIAPGASANLSDDEIAARNRGPLARPWVDTQAQSSVSIDFNKPTVVGLGDQFFGPAANNTAYFMMAINLAGLLTKATAGIIDPEQNLVAQSVIDAVLYSAFYIPFAMATNQNPSDTFKYGPNNWLAKTVTKDVDRQEEAADADA